MDQFIKPKRVNGRNRVLSQERMHTKHKTLLLLALFSALLVLPLLVNGAFAQEQVNYYVTIKPTLPEITLYGSIGKNLTVPFEAKWTYGDSNGQFIQNATVTFDAIDQSGKVIDTVTVNTTRGAFDFNYTYSSPAILTLNATKVVTPDGQEWTDGSIDSANNVYGLISPIAQVMFDTFHVSLISYHTSTSGKIDATVNVTRLLFPEEGFGYDTGYTKIVENADVTINGVQAQEIQPGIYTAASSTWLPTAYICVKVSTPSWTTSATGFSFTHDANQPIWMYGVGFASVVAVAALCARFMTSKRANKNSVDRHPNFPFFGGVTLVATSVFSLYWGVVGMEGTAHTFNWIGLAVAGLLAFVFGVVNAILLVRKKYLPLTIFAVILPMIANVLAIKTALDMYQLANPWILLFGALVLSLLSGFFICNIEDNSSKS